MRVVLRFLPAALLMGVLGGRAEAGLVLKLSDTADLASVTIVDNGLGDLSPDMGVVTFAGPLGEFHVNVSTGLSTPVLGSGLLPPNGSQFGFSRTFDDRVPAGALAPTSKSDSCHATLRTRALSKRNPLGRTSAA